MKSIVEGNVSTHGIARLLTTISVSSSGHFESLPALVRLNRALFGRSGVGQRFMVEETTDDGQGEGR